MQKINNKIFLEVIEMYKVEIVDENDEFKYYL